MNQNIATFLKEKRKAAGFTQEEFALRAGVGLPFIRAMEQENHSLTTRKMNQVLGMFNAKLGVVLKTEEDEG